MVSLLTRRRVSCIEITIECPVIELLLIVAVVGYTGIISDRFALYLFLFMLDYDNCAKVDTSRFLKPNFFNANLLKVPRLNNTERPVEKLFILLHLEEKRNISIINNFPT